MNLRTLKSLDVSNKTVLVRAGFDVPLKDGRVEDETRIRDAVPTVKYLAQHNAKVILIAHLGRPEGWDEKFSLEPVARSLADLLQRKLIIISEEKSRLPEYAIPHLYFIKLDIEKNDVKTLLSQMRPADIALLENLRFYGGEKKNDPEFAQKLASLADAYVNEAFSNSHRDDASMTAVAKLLPRAAGLSLEKEILALERLLYHPVKPLVVMIGGVKLAEKAPAIGNLAKIADNFLLGGGLANLFLKVVGYEIGKSVISRDKQDDRLGRELWRNYKDKIRLPVDAVVSHNLEGEPEVVKVDKVKPSQMVLDIGPETIREYSKHLKAGKTLLWNGPLGYFERKAFSHGTLALGRLFASRGRGKAYAVAGGGETLEAIARVKLGSSIDHISTGGGAMLEFLAGTSLPAIQVLYD
ncbi:MAG: phosphoglycerate kinase [Candidatus Doudnabacteria bacterium]|nr:phosphoglycerate kinase [Candidatus Doudnabacteria bacterium]